MSSINTSCVEVVEWHDAQVENTWDDNTKANLAECITVGFLVDESKQAICLALTVADTHTCGRMHIPKKWIKSRKSFIIKEEVDGQTKTD